MICDTIYILYVQHKDPEQTLEPISVCDDRTVDSSGNFLEEERVRKKTEYGNNVELKWFTFKIDQSIQAKIANALDTVQFAGKIT